MGKTEPWSRGVARVVVVVGLAVALLSGGAVPLGAASGDGGAPPTLLAQFIDQAEKIDKGEVTIAVVRAADRGYDLGQILEGVFAGALDADGTITEDGDPVAPSQPSAGVITGNAAASGGPGRARGPRVRAADDVTLPDLEQGLKQSQRQLDKDGTLPRIADDHATTPDVAMMLVILALANEGYSIEQIIVDGIMAKGINVTPFGREGAVVIRDQPGGKGDVVKPEFATAPATGDSDADAISNFLDGVVDAVSGEDPLAVTDNSFKREYTLTIEVEIVDADSTLRIEGKANAGAAKAYEDAGIVAGRGTGTFTGEGQCWAEAGTDTAKHAYTLSAPVRLGILGRPSDVRGRVRLGTEVTPSSSVRVRAADDALCLDLVREGANQVLSLVEIPVVEVRWKNGASASEEGATSYGAAVTVKVSVRKI